MIVTFFSFLCLLLSQFTFEATLSLNLWWMNTQNQMKNFLKSPRTLYFPKHNRSEEKQSLKRTEVKKIKNLQKSSLPKNNALSKKNIIMRKKNQRKLTSLPPLKINTQVNKVWKKIDAKTWSCAREHFFQTSKCLLNVSKIVILKKRLWRDDCITTLDHLQMGLICTYRKFCI